VRVTGAFQPADGLPAARVEIVTRAIYGEETGGTPLWQETQNVTLDAEGRYTVLLGATRPEGLPLDVFASGEARWLGKHVERPGEGEQPRVRLTSVHYALRASNADTLGGLPPSAYLRAEPGASDGATSPDGGTAKTASESVGPLATTGTANFIGKFLNTTDLGNSALYEVGGQVGVGTTSPRDTMSVSFTNTSGAFTGYAVQNLGSTATSYSGMLSTTRPGRWASSRGSTTARTNTASTTSPPAARSTS
jgi:hypothetical protein